MIPAHEGVRKVGKHEGEPFDVAGAHLTWKARAEDTGYAFSINEQVLGHGESVPLHSHPYAEVFYILEGEVEFSRFTNGVREIVSCSSSDTLIIPPNALHGFQNKAATTARLLGVSTALHQAFFDAISALDRTTPFSEMAFPDAMAKVAETGAHYHMRFVPLA
jgi:quercetin dioxygenase-like cupin family protein